MIPVYVADDYILLNPATPNYEQTLTSVNIDGENLKQTERYND